MLSFESPSFLCHSYNSAQELLVAAFGYGTSIWFMIVSASPKGVEDRRAVFVT